MDEPVRVGPRLSPDPRRVIAKLFVAGEESTDSESRIHLIVGRVAGLSDDRVSAELSTIRRSFGSRHRDFEGVLHRHASMVSPRLHPTRAFSDERVLLLGAYLTHEYSVEAAALCNPSMVLHPDQTGVPAGTARFLMSVRAIGEGHLSSVEFRTGCSAPRNVTVDDPGRYLELGVRTTATHEKSAFIDHLSDLGVDRETSRQLLSELPEVFHDEALRRALAALHPHLLSRQAVQLAVQLAGNLASNSYELTFPAGLPLSEQLLWPTGMAESHGMEDVRLVRFLDGDGTATYHGTYTAYDGNHIAPHLLTTQDFRRYRVAQMTGPAAINKGMALFPRRVAGRQFALSRWDRENISLATSADGLRWERGPVLRATVEPWEFIQVGNCGSPLETEAGWLVLTHGVGPMRTYSVGAMLLDLDDPSVVLAETAQPLLTPEAGERDGYVPNVVYSCGGMLHEDTLTIPYGTSDTSIGFAQLSVADLIAELRDQPHSR
jgi:predicted GH43/DUF377 family glycosyl hydrolase